MGAAAGGEEIVVGLVGGVGGADEDSKHFAVRSLPFMLFVHLLATLVYE